MTWPATIVRGTSTTNVTLTGAVSPSNIDPGQFKLLRQLLVTDDQDITTNVVWTVSAFDVNGGYIAFQHPAPLSSGQIQAVNFAFDGGGWGVSSVAPPSRAEYHRRPRRQLQGDICIGVHYCDHRPAAQASH